MVEILGNCALCIFFFYRLIITVKVNQRRWLLRINPKMKNLADRKEMRLLKQLAGSGPDDTWGVITPVNIPKWPSNAMTKSCLYSFKKEENDWWRMVRMISKRCGQIPKTKTLLLTPYKKALPLDAQSRSKFNGQWPCSRSILWRLV